VQGEKDVVVVVVVVVGTNSLINNKK